MVSRIYGGFRGADFRGDEVNLSRSPDLLNVWKDYKETESIRTRPSMRMHFPVTHKTWGIFSFRGSLMVHDGAMLKWLKPEGTKTIYTGLNQAPSQAFVYDDLFYIMDGKRYLVFDGETINDVVGYIPTTTIARKPMGGGERHEDVNMLSDYRINTFLADGVSFSFFLDSFNIDSDYAPIVKINDEVVDQTTYTVDYAEGKIVFTNTPPEPPLTDGQDNVWVQFKKAVPQYKAAIMGCSMLQVFDNRVFFSGNPDHPSMVWHCSLHDPTYIQDLDYYQEGMDEARVTGMVAGNNALWVFREPSEANTTVFYHTPTTDEEYGKIYPSVHSSVSVGCIGKAINFGDDIVFFSDRGMEGISGDVTTEQAVAHRSSLVDRKLTTEGAYRDMVLAEWEGYLLVFISDKAYLADSRTMFQNGNHGESEWFYWQMDREVLCAFVKDGVLYLGCEDGVYTLDGEDSVEAYFVTAKDKFDAPHKLKTTNKRGCVGEGTGDLTVLAKTEATDFEEVERFDGVRDYFVCRLKRKKFKDLQIKIHSMTRFSLETVTMECFIGGYIKR